MTVEQEPINFRPSYELIDPKVMEADNVLRRQQEIKEKIEGHQPKKRKNQLGGKQTQSKSKLVEHFQQDDLQVIALKKSAVINNEFSQLVMDLVPEDKFSRVIKHECKVGVFEKPIINIPKRVAEVVRFASRAKLRDEPSPLESQNADEKMKNRSGFTSEAGSTFRFKPTGKT